MPTAWWRAGASIFTGGQIGWNERGEFESDELVDQIGQTLTNIAAILEAAGATPEHITSMTWYLTDLAEYRAGLKRMGPVYRSVDGPAFPADGGGRGHEAGRGARQGRNPGDGGDPRLSGRDEARRGSSGRRRSRHQGQGVGSVQRSGHLDTFTRDSLPPEPLWPKFVARRSEFARLERLNCVSALLDRWIAEGRGERPCLIAPGGAWTYGELAERVDRIANVLVGRLGLVSGNRVLLRAANTPMLVAVYLARDEGGRRRGGDHAAAARARTRRGRSTRRGSTSRCATRACWRNSRRRALKSPVLARIVAFGDGRRRKRSRR